MSRPIELLLVAGARPNFMKVAPLIKAIQAGNSANPPNSSPKVSYQLVHTGQHYDEKMSDIFFRELGIPPANINLEVGSGTHAVQTANIMLRFEKVLDEHSPDWVVVVGDVNSTMACTLVASKRGVRVAHVEAGLRSFDRTMPEELNRLVTDALADLLLTPSEDADENLVREGVPRERIRRVGNIMIDALVANLGRARQSPILGQCGVQPGRYAFVTLHRPSNVDRPETLRRIVGDLARLAERMPIVFPIHPRTRAMLAGTGIVLPEQGGIRLLAPVGYHDSLCLTENAAVVLTDSGGLQEESTYFGTPCLTLRPNTERPATITHGSNRLTSPENLWRDLEQALGQARVAGRIPPLWDGSTSQRILAALTEA